jgi:hypothetical protein
MKTIFYVGAFISICSAGFSLFVGILTLKTEHHKKYFPIILSIFLGSIIITIATYRKESSINQGNSSLFDKNEAHFIDTTAQKSIGSTAYQYAKAQHDSTNDYTQTLTVVKRNGKYGFVNKENKEVINCQYENVFYLPIGLIMVTKNKKIGFVCKSGDTISCQYDLISPFSENGLAAVKKANKWGYIDKYGKEIIACQYYSPEDFPNGNGNLNNGQTSTLTENDIKKIKPECIEIATNYTENIKRLSNQNVNAVEKNGLAKEVIDHFFVNDRHLDNDESKTSTQQYTASEYMNSIRDIYSELNINFSQPTVRDVYYNTKDSFYYLIATTEKNIISGNHHERKQIDIYFIFNTRSTPKIYSIRNHSDALLANLKPYRP